MTSVTGYRTLAADRMSENDLQNHILQLAEARRWLTYHVYDSRRSSPGFPDLVMARHGRLIVAELKSMRGHLSEPQQAWLAELRMVNGIEVHLWRPADLLSGAIAAVLALTTTMLQRVTAKNQTLQAQLTAARNTNTALVQAVRDFIADEQHLDGCRCRLCVALTEADGRPPK